ncbi:MAG: PKD domain-containing protein [Crocinitomicaceae bacterium]
MKWILTLAVLIISLSGSSQEICDNGIDDDGDGLIDLNDKDCQCGAGLNAQFNNAIPNPEFNNSSCCVTTWNQHLSCLDDWSTDTTFYNSSWALNYVSACNNCTYWSGSTFYIAPPECATVSNNGFLGMGFWDWNNNNNNWNWNKYASSCLNTPFYPGNTYVLEFDAFNTHNFNWQYMNDTIHISIVGTNSCNNIPYSNNSGTSCLDPNWYTLDSIEIVVPVDTAWHQFSFSFTPTDTVYAMALGQTCNSFNTNQTYNGWQRLLLDNLTLYDSKVYDLQIAESGSICNPPYVLTSSIDTTGGTWQWYQDSVALVGETNPTIDITALGDGNFTVLYSMNGTCQGRNLEVLPAVYPFAFQTPVSNPICTGDSIYFDGFSFINSGTIDNYYYDFGNGDSAFVEDPVYAFDTPGTYTVTYTAESNQQCTASESQTITVYGKPSVDFSASNQCIYDNVDFISLSTVTSSLIDSLAWDFDDNSFAHDSLESHLYNSAGNFDIRLFVRSNHGCTDSITKTITIHPAPQSSYSANNDCENIGIPFTNLSSVSNGTIINYNWNFDDGNSSSVFNPTHTFDSYGPFNTKLLVTSDSGCVDSSFLQVIVHPEPTANFTPSSSCFLANFDNISSIPSGTIDQTNWNFGNTLTSTDVDPSHYYTVNGNYNVNLETISNFGCVDDTTISITIFNNFNANFSPLDSLICSKESVRFTNKSTEVFDQEVNYIWELSNGQTSTEKDPLFTFVNNSDITKLVDVSLKISTSSGCIDSLFKMAAITVIPTPEASFYFTPEKPSISNSEVQFTNLSVRADSYEWNFGDNTNTIEIAPTHKYPEYTKSYTVTLKAYNNSEKICVDQESKLLIIQDEILFFIPNAFSPDGSGINDFFSPQFVSGIDIYNFRLQVFNRWGEIVFESNDPAVGWDGKFAGEFIKEDVYIWKIDFAESFLDKTHTHHGSVTVVR